MDHFLIHSQITPKILGSALTKQESLMKRAKFCLSNLSVKLNSWESKKLPSELNILCNIRGRIFFENCQTTISHGTSEPFWPEISAQVFVLFSRVIWDTQHIVFEVLDVEESTNHTIGHAVVSLLDAKSKPKGFTVPIMIHGFSCGSLSGTIKLEHL